MSSQENQSNENSFPEQPDPIDRLADQAGSYDEARRWRGEGSAVPRKKTWEEIEADKQSPETAKPKKKKLTPEQRRRIARNALGPQYGEEAGVGYPGGKPPEHQNFPAVSPEQAATNHYYATHWDEVGKRAIEEGTHQVDDEDQ